MTPLTWLRSSTALALLFLFSVSPRALLMSIVPLEALARLGDARDVSMLFFIASVFGVLGSLMIPLLVRWINAFGVFHLAAGCACASSVLLSQAPLPVFLAGMVTWVLSAVAFEISTQLYVLARVPRNQLTTFEPRRILFAVFGYSIGPWGGVMLAEWVDGSAPFVAAFCASLCALCYFHLLRLRPIPKSTSAAGQSGSPLRHIRRFYAQPRLRLAWLIAFSRTAWWSTFFIYAPIYVVSVGMSDGAAGGIVSLGVSTVFTVTLWARLGRRYGFRALCIGACIATGLISVLVPFFSNPLVCAGVLLLAAAAAAALDGAGHITYLRAVRPRERDAMSGVYATYRDFAQLIPPALFAVVLTFAPLPVVFAIAGAWMLVVAWFCGYLPKRLI